MPWQLDTARGWWLLARDILLFGLGSVIWINELLLSHDPVRVEALVAGAAAMAIPFALRQDEKT